MFSLKKEKTFSSKRILILATYKKITLINKRLYNYTCHNLIKTVKKSTYTKEIH